MSAPKYLRITDPLSNSSHTAGAYTVQGITNLDATTYVQVWVLKPGTADQLFGPTQVAAGAAPRSWQQAINVAAAVDGYIIQAVALGGDVSDSVSDVIFT